MNPERVEDIRRKGNEIKTNDFPFQARIKHIESAKAGAKIAIKSIDSFALLR